MSTPAFGGPKRGRPHRQDRSRSRGGSFGTDQTMGFPLKTEGRMNKIQGRMRPGTKGQLTDPKQARIEALKKARSRYKEA